jgi:alanine-synthesizing transaminase
VKSYLDYGTFRPLQLAAAWALDNGDALVDEIRSRYEERLHALATALTECGWSRVARGAAQAVSVPGGTMFLWAPVPAAWSGVTSMDVTRRLIERAHVAVAPGSGFGNRGEGFVRFSLIADPPVLREACERIGRALA